MSQENVAVVRTGFEAFNRRDQAAFLAVFAPDVRFRSYLDAVDPQAEQGHDGMRAWWDRVLSVIPNWEFWPVDLRDLDDHVVVEVHQTGSAAQSGIPIDETLWSAFTLRAGRITRWATFRTEQEALEAVGLRESAMSQENVEALKAVYAKWAVGNFWTPEIFDPEVETVWAEEMPDATRTARGLSGVETGIRNWLAPWDECRWIADKFIPVEDGVVLVFFTARGRGKGSTVEVEAHWAHLWTFREGKATRLEGFVDPAQALEAAGLSEQDAVRSAENK
jgi:ketosteroid isomerase-like protein